MTFCPSYRKLSKSEDQAGHRVPVLGPEAGWAQASGGRWAPSPLGAGHAEVLAPLSGAPKKKEATRPLVRSTLGHHQCPPLCTC